MDKYFIVHSLSNSWGSGYEISLEHVFEQRFYGYSKKEVLKRYKSMIEEKTGCSIKGMHFQLLHFGRNYETLYNGPASKW